MKERIAQIAHEIQTQDNRITAVPIFAVRQRKRVYGFDPLWCDGDGVAWINTNGDDATGEMFEKLEEQHKNGESPSGWNRTVYCDQWEFVTACFTEKGCEDYIAANKHNLCEPNIYVYGGYRNEEWKTLREFLVSQQ